MPPRASSKRPLLSATAPVKAPRTWPKSSDSRSPSGSAPQLTGTKGRADAAAVAVDGPGHELLAGAGLAGHEDGGVGGAGEGDLLVDGEHAPAAADEAVRRRAAGGERGRPRLAGAGAPGQGAGDHVAHLADVHRLAHVVEGPRLHRLERRLQRPEGADEHHLDLRVPRLERAQQVEAGQLRVQVDVGEDEVEAPALEERERVLRGSRPSRSRAPAPAAARA